MQFLKNEHLGDLVVSPWGRGNRIANSGSTWAIESEFKQSGQLKETLCGSLNENGPIGSYI